MDGDDGDDGHARRTPDDTTAVTPALPAKKTPPDDPKKKKHGRVHKREQELYGLVTPVFLPLLDARESPPTKREPAAPAPAPPTDMPADAPARERAASEPAKKPRRASLKKKSALRHASTPRNRKRVSLVVDDQVVLPSDTIREPVLADPGSETTSATNSTASLDDMIDPRLTDAPVYTEHAVHGDAHTAHHTTRHPVHRDAVHHSLPLTMTSKPAPPAPSPHPPLVSPTPTPLPTPLPTYTPPSYANRALLDPPSLIPLDTLPLDNLPLDTLPPSPSPAASPANFRTYVGGLSGSGVDDVNQAGSVGYPSSLGASYLESYMATRPLSVRMAAVERGEEGVDGAEGVGSGGVVEQREEAGRGVGGREGSGEERDGMVDLGEEEEFLGSMDGF